MRCQFRPSSRSSNRFVRFRGGTVRRSTSSTSRILKVLESRRGTDHDPNNARWGRFVFPPDYHLAALSTSSRTDTETNRTQSVVVLDCVDSVGEFHWTVGSRVPSVARCGQEVRRCNVRAKNVSVRSCLLRWVASSFSRSHLPKQNRKLALSSMAVGCRKRADGGTWVCDVCSLHGGTVGTLFGGAALVFAAIGIWQWLKR
jgi:hypothetical protein